MGLFSCFSANYAGSPNGGSPAPASAGQAPFQPVPQASPRRVQFEDPPATLQSRHSAPASPSTTPPPPSDTQPLYMGPGSDTPPADAAGVVTTSPRSPRTWSARSPSKSAQATLAATLRSYTDESADPPIQQYLQSLGKHGAGLKEAVYYPDVGHIFGMAYRLSKLVSQVVVNQENAAMAAGMGQDVVRALDLAGKTNVLSSVKLSGLVKQLQDMADMVALYSREGWLLHMAFNDHLKADFDNQHNAIMDTLEAARLEVPGKSNPLPRGAYLDVNRAFRRGLKGIGGGSVAQGLRVAAGKNLDIVHEMATQLGVTDEAVLKELDALPAGAEVPLDVYYSRMVVRAATQAVADRYRAIFNRYDKGGKGHLDRSNIQAVLSDLGALEGVSKPEAEAAVSRGFSLADRDADGKVSLEEFCRYFDTLTCSDARKRLRVALGPHAEDELRDVFTEFASFGTRQAVEDMDCAHFVKLFKDCNLMGKDLTVTDIDLAFARAKPKGSRRLDFNGFIAALAECAELKKSTLDDIACDILASRGPVARATKAGNVRLHDDKSTYTGVYAKGGPKVNDAQPDLAAMLDRSDAAAAKKTPAVRASRGLPLTVVEKPVAQSMGGAPPTTSVVWNRRSTIGGTTGINASPLYEMWLLWAQFGNGMTPSNGGSVARTEMGVAQFIKMMRETGLLDKSFNAVQAELAFMKVRPKGAVKINFKAFEKCLALIAEAKGMSTDEVEQIILSSQGPMLTTRVN